MKKVIYYLLSFPLLLLIPFLSAQALPLPLVYDDDPSEDHLVTTGGCTATETDDVANAYSGTRYFDLNCMGNPGGNYFMYTIDPLPMPVTSHDISGYTHLRFFVKDDSLGGGFTDRLYVSPHDISGPYSPQLLENSDYISGGTVDATYKEAVIPLSVFSGVSLAQIDGFAFVYQGPMFASFSINVDYMRLDNRPTVGYAADDIIPASTISQATDGSGQVTIQFKVKDPADSSTTLDSFEYSVDGGLAWNAPTGGDGSGALAGFGSAYSAATDWSGATHSITLDTRHSDLTGLNNTEQNDVEIRFKAYDGATDPSPGDVTDDDFGVSESFAVDNQNPTSTASVPSGTYNSSQSVELTADESATVYYTTDESTPTTSSPQYSGPIAISETTTLKFFAQDQFGNQETPQTLNFTINIEEEQDQDDEEDQDEPKKEEPKEEPTPKVIPPRPKTVLTFAGLRGSSHLRTFDFLGVAKHTPGFYAYYQPLRFGYNVAAGDLNGDGKDEIVTAPQKGGRSHIRIFDNLGRPKFTPGFYAYPDENMTCGVDVAVGDLNGDGKAEIVTIPGEGCSAQVRIFNYIGEPVFTPGFYAYHPDAKYGFRVAVGDLNDDGKAEIVTAPEKHAKAHVRIFNYIGQPEFTPGFYAYDDLYTGADVAVADLNGDKKAEIITVPGDDNPAHVRMFNYIGEPVFHPGYYAYGKNVKTGFHVAAADLNNDGKAEVITSPKQEAPAYIRSFNFVGQDKFSPGFYAYKLEDYIGADVAVGAF